MKHQNKSRTAICNRTKLFKYKISPWLKNAVTQVVVFMAGRFTRIQNEILCSWWNRLLQIYKLKQTLLTGVFLKCNLDRGEKEFGFQGDLNQNAGK